MGLDGESMLFKATSKLIVNKGTMPTIDLSTISLDVAL